MSRFTEQNYGNCAKNCSKTSWDTAQAPHEFIIHDDTEQQEKKQACATMVYSSFVWRPSQLQKYQDCHRRQDTGLLNRRNHHCWSRPRQLTGSIVLCIHSRQAESVLQWLFTGQIEIFRAFYFCGRQTIENSIVHMGTNLYQCTHIMTSSISILVNFFVVYIYFRRSRSVHEIRENLHPVKISHYTV